MIIIKHYNGFSFEVDFIVKMVMSFLYDLVIFSLISFSWVSGGISYKLLVLSAKTSRFGDFLIF